jgi:cytochrome c-type biogenesis protein CcmH/NrfF
MMRLGTIVAHQGGWDEVLLFAVPVAVALIAVRIVERRARRTQDQAEADSDASDGAG